MKIKFLILSLAALATAGIARAQDKVAAFDCGERLEFVVSYRAKLVPNSDVAKVTLNTSCKNMNGSEVYHVVGHARVQPFFKWFFDLNDTYNSWIDRQTLLPLKFNAELREGGYSFTHTMTYDWGAMRADSRFRNMKRTETTQKTLRLSQGSFDALAGFYNLRSTPASSFTAGQSRTMKVVLEDTVRSVRYKFLGREVREIKNFGHFRTLKFSCQLATSTGESFEDGTEFFIWITDDLNKVPLYIESPIRVGSIRATITRMEGLKFPSDSKVR
jgi:hypothetical protein